MRGVVLVAHDDPPLLGRSSLSGNGRRWPVSRAGLASAVLTLVTVGVQHPPICTAPHGRRRPLGRPVVALDLAATHGRVDERVEFAVPSESVSHADPRRHAEQGTAAARVGVRHLGWPDRFGSVGHEDRALAGLRNAVVGGAQHAAPGPVAPPLQDVRVAAPERQYIGDLLKRDPVGQDGAREPQRLQHERGTVIMPPKAGGAHPDASPAYPFDQLVERGEVAHAEALARAAERLVWRGCYETRHTARQGGDRVAGHIGSYRVVVAGRMTGLTDRRVQLDADLFQAEAAEPLRPADTGEQAEDHCAPLVATSARGRSSAGRAGTPTRRGCHQRRAVILDLFAGVGWAEGLRSLGLEEIGIELDPAVCETRHAAGHHNTIRADVAAYPISTLPGRVAGLIASPPCQAFSRAGKRLGMRDLPALYELVEQIRRTSAWVDPAGRRWHDDRSPLVLEPLRFAGAILPAWIALEQIPDVLPLWRRYAHILERWGYRTWSGVLNTADYGVPQTRERAMLMAVRGGSVRPPEPTLCEQRRGGSLLGMATWVSMADALGWHGELDPLINSTMGGGKIKRYYRTTERPSPTVRGCADRWGVHTHHDDSPLLG